jgi:hypothetical protein
MMAVLTEAERDVIEAAIWDLRSFMHREAEKYYENVIFLAAIVAGIAEMISTWRDDERY